MTPLQKRLQAAEPAVDEMAARRLRRRVLQDVNEPGSTTSWSRGRKLGAASALGSLAGALGLLVYLLGRADSRAPEPMAASTLLPPPGGSVQVQPSSDLIVQGDAQTLWTRESRASGDEIVLQEGSLTIEVQHTSNALPQSAQRVLVRVPDGRILDLGTRFRVQVEQRQTRAIDVMEGAVVLQRPGRPDVHVERGTMWRSEQEAPPAPAAQPARRRAPASAAQPAPAPQRQPRVADSAAEDAAYLRFIGLLRAGRRADARRAGLEYLQRFPDGFRRSEVESTVNGNLGGSASP